jgi:hypothetical protein
MEALMWTQYKKTARFMQPGIAVIAIVAFFLSGRALPVALWLFMVMQVGAVLGAFWASNLKRRIEARRGRLQALGI